MSSTHKISKVEVKPSSPLLLPSVPSPPSVSMPRFEISPTKIFGSQTGSGVSSVPGRTQSLEGGNVEPMDALMQDVPVHLEMNLRKANKRKRHFKPSIPNVRRRKESSK
jgi:hypothetical protein